MQGIASYFACIVKQAGLLPPKGMSSWSSEGRTDRHHSVVEKRREDKPRVTFSKCTITSICKRELCCPAFPPTCLYFLARKTHLWGQIPFACWYSPNGLSGTRGPHTGCSWSFRHAVLPAHAVRTCCWVPGSSARSWLPARAAWVTLATNYSFEPPSISTSHILLTRLHTPLLANVTIWVVETRREP